MLYSNFYTENGVNTQLSPLQWAYTQMLTLSKNNEMPYFGEIATQSSFNAGHKCEGLGT